MPTWLSSAESVDVLPCAADTVPQHLAPWIALQGSMTHKLSEHFGQMPAVEVHFSGESELCDWEKEGLGRPTGTVATGYARHISLNIDARPVLFARSVTANHSPLTPLLAELQRTPLAKVLFEDENWQRVGNPAPLRSIDAGSEVHFGRACIWCDRRHNEHLVVEEFFLF